MKPIHKFNNGQGATICHKCNCIISIGFTDDLYCKECIKEQDKNMYSKEELINISIQYFNHYYNISSRGRLIIDHDLEWFEQFKK